MSSTKVIGAISAALLLCTPIWATSCGDPDHSGGEMPAAGGAPEGGGPASSAGENSADSAGSASGPDAGGASQAGGDTGAAGTAVVPIGGASSCSASPDPTPTLPASAALDADAVARAAVVLGSCVPDDGVDRNAQHLWSNQLTLSAFFYRLSTQLECLANAACGCEAVRHCYGWELAVVDETCETTCTNEVFHTCAEDDGGILSYSIDCGSLGLACDEQRGCAEPGGEPCADDGYLGCSGDQFIGCSGEQTQYGPVCADLGLTCESGGCQGTGAQCVDTGDGSSEDEVPIAAAACDGDDLLACVNGRAATIACAARGPGFTCQNVAQAFFCGLASDCVPASNGAPSESAPPSCDGNELVFCNAGRFERIDCTTLGFSGCGHPESPSQFGCVP